MSDPKPNFNLGDVVILKPYLNNHNEVFLGNANNVPPYFAITGVEIESKKKRTHHAELKDVQISERVKYNVMWFDAKNSTFHEKLVYESMIALVKEKSSTITYKYSLAASFVTNYVELQKKKNAKSYREYPDEEGEIQKSQTIYTIDDYSSPFLLMSDYMKNTKPSQYYEDGSPKTIEPEHLVKVLWFNHKQNKLSEYLLPLEVLEEIKDQKECAEE